MDLSFGQIIQAALRDDASAMTNRTLWACDDLLEGYTLCRSGLDLTSVVLALRSEAQARGLWSMNGPDDAGPPGPDREVGA
jgi:heterodisulfide reductase subunit C